MANAAREAENPSAGHLIPFPQESLISKLCHPREGRWGICPTICFFLIWLGILATMFTRVNMKLVERHQDCRERACRNGIEVTVTGHQTGSMLLASGEFECWLETSWNLLVNSTLTVFRSDRGTCCIYQEEECSNPFILVNTLMMIFGTLISAGVSAGLTEILTGCFQR
jgi:hypothetical protein